MRRLILLAAICLSAIAPCRTLSAQDSIKVSLVTCTPGKLVYELYGHTAIRIQDSHSGTDLAYNYGLFNFETPHFIWRWLKGETDYLLGRETILQLVNEYVSRGSSVYFQELGLNYEEALKIKTLLDENSKPENRVYRYDFLRNNCATMALDKIEEAVGGSIRYKASDTVQTFRDILHEFNRAEPWTSFGTDLIVGAEADSPISERETAFAPICLMHLLNNAIITDTAGNAYPIVASAFEIAPDEPVRFSDFNISPLQAMILIMLFVLLICCIEWNVKRIFWIVDVIIFAAQGIAGLLIGFLVLFSSHPTADSNWLFICLNPLPLICLPFVIRNIIRRHGDIFLVYNLAVTVVFIILSGKIPQYIAPATLVMLAIFALRSLSDIHFLYGISMRKIFNNCFSKGKRAAVIAILVLSTSAMAQAQSTRQTPKLVVGIVIDQLDREYVRRLMPLFEDEGFRRFWYHGYNLPNVSFDYDGKDRASAIASIYTGSTPFYHGIVGEDWTDRKNFSKVGAVDDSDERGINTTDRCSPKRLQVLTVTDRLELQSGGGSITCSIAAERDAAVLAGGHDPDVVLWMNDADGQWCTSGYYGSFPTWAAESGNGTASSEDEWRPSLPAAYYVNDSNDPRTRYFFHKFSRGETSLTKTSPLANTRITEMAIKSIDEMQLGVSGATDFLAVTYYAGGLGHQPAGLESMELQDTYARLDRNIADLINHIDQKIGTGNVLFFLTSTGYHDSEAKAQTTNPRMPAGSVNMERVTALLNLYLSALYGSGEYISAYDGTQLYLNRDLLEKSEISIQNIYDHSVDLLLQMSGIRGVFTQRDLMSANLSGDARRKRDALNLSCSGDIVIEVIPGWTVIDELHGTSRIATRSVTEFPVMLYGAGVRAYTDERQTSVSSLAATVSWIAGIPAPDACSATPITEIW